MKLISFLASSTPCRVSVVKESVAKTKWELSFEKSSIFCIHSKVKEKSEVFLKDTVNLNDDELRGVLANAFIFLVDEGAKFISLVGFNEDELKRCASMNIIEDENDGNVHRFCFENLTLSQSNTSSFEV